MNLVRACRHVRGHAHTQSRVRGMFGSGLLRMSVLNRTRARDPLCRNFVGYTSSANMITPHTINYAIPPETLSLIVISTQMLGSEQQRCVAVADSFLQHQEDPFGTKVPQFENDVELPGLAPSLRALCVSRFLGQPVLSLEQQGYSYAEFLREAGQSLDNIPIEYKLCRLLDGQYYDDAWSRAKYREMVQYCKKHGRRDREARAEALGLDASSIESLHTVVKQKAAEFKKTHVYKRDSLQGHLSDTVARVLHTRGIKACLFLDDSAVAGVPEYVSPDPTVTLETVVTKLVEQQPLSGMDIQLVLQASTQGAQSCCELEVLEKKGRIVFGPLVTVEYDGGMVQQKRLQGNFHAKSPLIQSVIGAKNAQASKPAVERGDLGERAMTWQDLDDEESAADDDKADLLDEIVPEHVRAQREEAERSVKEQKQQAHLERVEQNERERSEKQQQKLGLTFDGQTITTQDGHFTLRGDKVVKTLRIFDGTAGFGTDSFLLRSCVQDDLDVQITLMERNPVMFLLLSDGLRRSMLHSQVIAQEESNDYDNNNNSSENNNDKQMGTLLPFTTDKTDSVSLSIIKIANASQSQFLYSKPKGNLAAVHQQQAGVFARDMTVLFGDSTQFLFHTVAANQQVHPLEQRLFDVVYIDPFYPMKQTGKHAEQKKQARNTKLMSLAKVLKTIYHQEKLNETLNTDLLKKLGRLACTQRCVIKRPSHADKPKEKNLLTYTDRKTRFDVQTPIGNVRQASALYQQLLTDFTQLHQQQHIEK